MWEVEEANLRSPKSTCSPVFYYYGGHSAQSALVQDVLGGIYMSSDMVFCPSTSPIATGGIPVYSSVGGGVVIGCDVSRGLESPMRGKVPGEMESSCIT